MNVREKISTLLKLARLLIVVGLVSCGGDQMRNYIQTTQSGIKTLPWPKQIEPLFGEGDHFITHYGFDSGPKEWNTEVFFGGRYCLTLQVMVKINYDKNLVETNTAPPVFYLIEVGKVLRGPSGVEGADISHEWVLDESKWNKLVEAKGDLSVLGVKTDDPIAGFDEYASKLRAPRARIPH